jgi:hypothetical protein
MGDFRLASPLYDEHYSLPDIPKGGTARWITAMGTSSDERGTYLYVTASDPGTKKFRLHKIQVAGWRRTAHYEYLLDEDIPFW